LPQRDQELLEFSISTGLKDIIGKELITDDRIAIFELVKNSYDAKARTAMIEFQNLTNPKEDSEILIIDDGEGMTHDDIRTKWLAVGFSEKKPQRNLKQSDYKEDLKRRGRLFAGAKGIGRFSADRLGKDLVLFTKKRDEAVIHSLHVDWTKFENNQEQEFQTIQVQYAALETFPFKHEALAHFDHGTVLRISALNSEWDAQKLKGLKTYLVRLINPAQQPDRDDFRISLVAREFLGQDEASRGDYERINGPIKNDIFDRLDKQSTKIQCRVTSTKIVTTLTDKGRQVFSLEERNTFSQLGDVDITVFFLNREAKALFTKIMGVQPKNYGSIFLYKNGFRIHPYGNEDDDWLGLDRRKTQGYRRNLGNRDVIGRIEVYGPQPGFQEVSSREGVVESEALRQLTIGTDSLFMEKVLRRLERYVVGAIDWDVVDKDTKQPRKDPEDVKISSVEVIGQILGSVDDPEKKLVFDKSLLKVVEERQIDKLPSLIGNIERLSEYMRSPAERSYLRQQAKSLKLAINKLEQETQAGRLALQVKNREALFLQKEMSVDKAILLNINHSIDIVTRTIRNKITDINREIQRGAGTSVIAPLIEDISLQNQRIRVLASIVSLANFNTNVKQITADIVAYVEDYIERVLGRRAGIIGHKFVNEELRFRSAFRPLEVSIMLDNFISNSEKAHATIITFHFSMKEGKLRLLVGDNGTGVDAKNSNFLFTRGFTTTDGSGLGLHHIKTIVEGMKGSVSFLGNDVAQMGKGACFEVLIGRQE
jgi:signal transduction histidine kinase